MTERRNKIRADDWTWQGPAVRAGEIEWRDESDRLPRSESWDIRRKEITKNEMPTATKLVACLIISVLFAMSPAVNASSGSRWYRSDCWRHDCRRASCPRPCQCPGLFQRLFGRYTCY
ncbi:uncharacterized protein LOC142564512 [Dermacentor variabilis]|uniref:uncharacterized protein LOC142564512 n=1 Tax=Dermacentor variabilis TaxID=34621 RepID=UPI003F5AE4B7